MKQVILFEKRRKARQLRKKGWSILKISRYLGAHWDSVKKWLEMDEDEILNDRRGRKKPKKKMFKYSEKVCRRILKIREWLRRQENVSFGSRAIKSEYKLRFGEEVSEWFINKVLREQRELKDINQRNEWSRQCECFPVNKLKRFGKVIMSIDFFGIRQRRGSGSPVCFLSCKYLYPYILGIVSQVSAQNCDEVMRILKYTFCNYVKPDLIKLNYNSAFGANLSRAKCIGRLPIFLLNSGIVPFYAQASCPDYGFDVGPIANVFTEPFSKLLSFPHKQDLEFKLENLYLEYRGKSDSSFLKLKVEEFSFQDVFSDDRLENRNVYRFLKGTIYFSRIVEASAVSDNGEKSGIIKVLNTEIELPAELIHSTVICRLDIKKKTGSVQRKRGGSSIKVCG